MKKHVVCAIVCGLIAVLPSGCVRRFDGDFCALYQPVYTSPHDTEETLRGVDDNNVVWMVLCEEE